MVNKKNLVNNEINVSPVRVIGADGAQLGILELDKAIMNSRIAGLDLVLVSPEANPPVCRILDWGKEQYAAKKKAKQSKIKQVIIQTKEIQLRPTIDDHDLDRKIRDAKKFLDKGNKVKFHMRFRGREASHSSIGMEVMNRILVDLGEITIEKTPINNGNNIMMIVGP